METFHHPPIKIPIPYNFGVTTTFASSPTATNSSSNSPWMDSRIWSRLPQRLIDRVIAFLPPPAFFRARAVCKRWYGLLFSSTFLELYLQEVSVPRRRRHCFFIFFRHKTLVKNYIYKTTNSSTSAGTGTSTRSSNHEEGYLFDPYEITWYRISFPLIPPGFSPASSSGGLLAWVSEDAGPKNILLCNPLLVGSLTPLPSTLRPRLFPSIGLTVTNSSVDVAIAGDDLISPYAVKNLSSESFHMDASGFYSIWGTTSALPRLCSLESGRMIYVRGRFYCMNYSPFSVLCYDVVGNQWCKIQAPMRRFLRSPCLVESRGGRLVLVAAVEKSKLNVPKSLRLWSLQDCGTTWLEIERMPQQLYLQFAQLENGNGFHCVGHGEFVLIFIRGSHHHHHQQQKALMFDFSKKRWLWIPPCPYIIHASSSADADADAAELHGFPYEPRLATPVTALLDQFTLPFPSFN